MMMMMIMSNGRVCGAISGSIRNECRKEKEFLRKKKPAAKRLQKRIKSRRIFFYDKSKERMKSQVRRGGKGRYGVFWLWV